MHRSTICEVFLTGFEQLGPAQFRVDGEWPRAHPFYAPRNGVHDPMLVVESARQIGALLAHGAYDVPLGQRFVLDSLQADVLPVPVGAGATDVVHSVTTIPVHRRGRLVRMSYTVQVEVAGSRVARIVMSFSCVSPAVYERMRTDALLPGTTGIPTPLPLPLPAADVGRTCDRDVVLLSGGGRGATDDTHDPAAAPYWPLRVDREHPFYFDHPLDHVPGMLLLEAARQAHTFVGDPEPGAMAVDVRFHAFTELGAPASLMCVPVESGVVVEVRQGERLTMTALLPDSPSRTMP